MLIPVAENQIERKKAREYYKSHSKGELAVVVLCGDN